MYDHEHELRMGGTAGGKGVAGQKGIKGRKIWEKCNVIA